MATADQFNKRMAKLGTNVTKNADKTVRKAAMAIDRTVVLATPVDTGRARANWLANLDASLTIPTSEVSKSGAQALVKAAGVIAGYDGDANTSIHITNNLPYILRLNEGSSAQAPANFVRRAVRLGIKSVKGAQLLKD